MRRIRLDDALATLPTNGYVEVLQDEKNADSANKQFAPVSLFIGATASQGSLADSAVQPTDINSLSKVNAIIADATLIDTTDARLSDARTPSAHTHPESEISDLQSYLLATDLSTLAALNTLLDDATLIDTTDSRLSDARTPTSHTHSEYAIISAVTRVEAGTTDTILATDNGKVLIYTSGSAVAVTLPDDLDVNFHVSIIQAGAGVVTVTRSGTDTINGAATGVTPSAQWKGMYLNQFAAGEFLALV